jgi:biopolymer transport protein TolQ
MFISQAWAQAAIEAEKTVTQNEGAFHIIGNADPVVKMALLVLIVFSVVSWAIIGMKFMQLSKAKKATLRFWQEFSQSRSLEEFFKGKHEKGGPLYEIYQTAVALVPRLKRTPTNQTLIREIVTSKLTQTQEEEIAKLEEYIPFLATTASTSPYIGLFGTVWGILMAFQVIGKSGASSLDTVGPFISEALVVTAVGLAAAIPAVIAYNYFVNRIKQLVKTSDLFVEELVLKIDEEVFS